MNAIEGTRRTMRELADGTIRLTVDIEPIYRNDFNRLFSSVDMPVAISPLVLQFDRKEDALNQATTVLTQANQKPKGGQLAKWAGIFCNDEQFQQFLEEFYGTTKPAKEFIYDYCGVTSRAELDHNQDAGHEFRHIMAAFEHWKGE